MSQAEVFVPTAITITDNAVSKILHLVEDESNPELKLRIFVTGGGCSGFQYGFSFDEKVSEDDTVVEKDGVSVLVDPLSFPYLVGSEVDYQEGLEGAKFLVSNPNASAICGCGESFSI